MSRGGYRAGAGRPKGSKIKTRSLKNIPEPELTPEQKEDIRLMLSFGDRIMDGGKLTRTEMKQLDEMMKKDCWKLTCAEQKQLDEVRKVLNDAPASA